MFKNLLKRPYKTLNLIEVNKKALLRNFRFFKKICPKTEICPVLKSNAYGHGLRLVGKFVDKEIRPAFICVDSLYEAYELEKEKVKTPILIMGYTFPENFKVFRRLNFSFPVYDKETLFFLDKYQPNAKIHLKIDTGMNRLGIIPSEAREFINHLKKCRQLVVEGIYSHLSVADDLSKEGRAFTRRQIKIFKEVIKIFEQEGFRFSWKHIAATAGAITVNDLEFNMARVGIGFYGISPFAAGSKQDRLLVKNLKPALKLISHIVQIKTVKKGEKVGYGKAFTAEKETKIGILPIGYYDGVDRKISNKGLVRYQKNFCRIIGNVCMNITMIDLTEVKKARIGDEVVVIEGDRRRPNSVYQITKTAGTIPYLPLVGLSETTRRVLN